MTSRYKLCVFREEDREVLGTAFVIVDDPSEADILLLDGHPAILQVLLASRDFLMAVNPYFIPPPVIVASGNPEVLALAAEMKLCCITKPFTVDELVGLVDAVVNWPLVRESTFLGDKEH